jgi:hypothetical protein
VIAAGALVIGGGAWLAWRGAPPRPHAAPEPARAASPAADPPHPIALEPAAAQSAPDAAETPALARHREALAFGEAVREFFASHGDLDEPERRARGSELLAQVDARERAGLLRPADALVLRLGIARAVEDDPTVLESETRRIGEEYREAEQRAAASRVPDPRDARYERGQAEIAREVMALDEIPSGLTREEYLRERLRELRIEVYSPESASE